MSQMSTSAHKDLGILQAMAVAILFLMYLSSSLIGVAILDYLTNSVIALLVAGFFYKLFTLRKSAIE